MHAFGDADPLGAPVLVLAIEVDKPALEGATWRLASVAHADGQLHTVPNGVEATASFANGLVSGSGGAIVTPPVTPWMLAS